MLSKLNNGPMRTKLCAEIRAVGIEILESCGVLRMHDKKTILGEKCAGICVGA